MRTRASWQVALALAVGVVHGVVQGGENAVLARSIGLTPEVLAAAGYTATDLPTIGARMADAADERAALASARQGLTGAAAARAAAESALQANFSDEQLRTDLKTAIRNVQTARETVTAAEVQLRTASLGTQDARAETVARIVVVPFKEVPIPLRAAQSLPASWPRIVAALTEEARGAQSETCTVSEESAQCLATMRSELPVITAQQDLDSKLPAIQAAWSEW